MNVGPDRTPALVKQPEHIDGVRLDPNSYTAHRLHHGTPDHLHLTTRRVFVGPIPVGWLKNHRSEWYKHHLHVFYSKRQATFSADGKPSQKRKVSGLERRDTEDWWTEEPESSVQPVGGAVQGADPVPIPRASSSSVAKPGRNGREPVDQAPETPQTRPITAKSRRDMKSPMLNRGESFATAYESWSSQGTEDRRPRSKARAEVDEDLPGSPTFMDMVSEEPMPFDAGDSDPGLSNSSVSQSAEAANSLVSLLRHDKQTQPKVTTGDLSQSRGRPGPVDKSDGKPSLLTQKTRAFAKPELTKLPPPISFAPSPQIDRKATNKERTAGGLVRFNTAVDVRERDKQMQLKLATLSQNRSLRRAGGLHRRKQEGEIIRMEKMLVRVEIAATQLPNDYDENESMKVVTRTAEKWREFVVVCRESAPNEGEDSLIMLKLYKSRVIPAIDKPHVSSHSTREIPLNPKTTRVNFYSSLDKTLVIWLPWKKSRTIIYIMRPRCSSSSVEWYTFLQKTLGWSRPDRLLISVPDLSLSLRVDNPFEKVERGLNEAGPDDDPLLKEEKVVAYDLLQKSLEMLDGIQEWESIVDHWKNNERMGLAWRRYDRLEWVHGANEQKMYGSIAMQKTHELELRPKVHYPTETKVEGGLKMTEPPPIEGFLIRLTSSKGQQERLGRGFFKRLYFTTHDNYLCFCKPSRALPPPPPKLPVYTGVIPTPSELMDAIPLIYAVSPYAPNADGEIEWLAKGTAQDIDCRDKDAYDEAERKVNTLLRSDGFVDLCKVEEVRLVKKRPRGANAAAAQGEGASFLRNAQEPNGEDDQIEEEIHDDKSFELVLNQGLILRLQAYNEQTRDEWILRLRELSTYWKARDRDDLAIIRMTRDANLNQLHLDEEMESLIGQFARKWEVSRSIASGELYNVCGLSSCRTLTMSGVLYRKPRKHATFRRYNVLLCHGELLIFHNAYRSFCGAELPHIHQERHAALSLRDCYIYSGLITENELLYSNQTFDSNSPGRHSVPRVYQDGLTSHDEDTMTCFVLWHGMRRKLFKTTDEEGRTVRKMVTSLGKTGKAIVFKARSRLERDAWVMGIGMEIERLNAGGVEEIRVTTTKGFCG